MCVECSMLYICWKVAASCATSSCKSFTLDISVPTSKSNIIVFIKEKQKKERKEKKREDM